MKKGTFLTLFLSTQIAFVFLHIHKHMLFIKQSFRKQKNERELAQYAQTKQELTNHLYALQSRSTIKEFAQKELQLKPLSLAHIKRITHDDN